jgi:L-fuculose-phosphate aldolase
MSYGPLREEIIEVGRAMNARRLNQGTSGNVSARVAEGMLITPSAVPYETMLPEDVVCMALDGEVEAGSRQPSTEWRLHAAVLRARPEVRAVLHAHAPACTALACLRREIPAFHYMVAVAGGTSIRCAPYATYGTAALAEAAVAGLEDRTACLLANHGMLALGKTPRKALALAVEVEALAETYLRTLQVGEPTVLSEEEMERVLEAFGGYGV